MRYRLPEDVFDGGEYEGSLTTFAGEPWVRFDVGGVRFYVGLDALTEVKPLPPEPPVSSVVRCGDGYIHIRQGPSWTDHDSTHGYCSWSDICTHNDGGEPVLLVPYPFAEPVELPWRVETHHDAVGAEVFLSDGVRVGVLGRHIGISFDEAYNMGRALWTAADAAKAAAREEES